MKRLFFLFFFVFFTFYIHTIDLVPKYLFINTSPLRAKVLIDDVDKGYLTPCIIRNLSASNKTISIVMDGYKKYNIDIAKIKSKKIEVNLTPSSFDLFFPEKSMYKIGDTQMKGPLYVSKLRSGNYNITVLDEKIAFSKISSFMPAEVSLGTSLGISSAFMIATIALAEYYKIQSYSTRDDFDSRYFNLVSRGFDIGKYVSISITSILTLALTSVIIADISTKRYDKKQKMEVENKAPGDRGETLYDTSLQFLSMGEIERSSNVLQSLIALYPESDYIPRVYYQLGQNYYIIQEFDKALENWLVFIRDYPLAAYYDYVLKNIAEIYYLNKDYKKAINMLDKVVFTENILDRETIFSFKAKLDFEVFKTTKDKVYYKLTENDYLILIDNSQNSERLDFYFLQLIQLYKMNGDSDKLVKLKNKAQEIKEPSVKQLVLSYF